MKKKHMVYAMLGVYALYSICTPFGAMKLQALIISRNPAVYFNLFLVNHIIPFRMMCVIMTPVIHWAILHTGVRFCW